jgi:4-aminobutyrate aminotransferase-like enzyme
VKRHVLTDEVPGPESRRLMDIAAAQEGPSVARQSTTVWSRAEGVYVTDVDGNVFLDFTSAVLLANVGHRHPRVVAAIHSQADELLHSYNFVNPWRVKLGQKLLSLAERHGLTRVFIGSTGAELVELSLKLARWKTGRSGTLALEGGYHGKTIAATAVGGRPDARAGLGDLLSGVIHLPFPKLGAQDFAATEAAAITQLGAIEADGTAERIGTVIVETLQGNAGQRHTSERFLQELQAFARRHAAVLIADETQSAFGRAGTMFAFEQFGLAPDLVVAGKGISSSLPLTVLLGRSEVFDAAPKRALSSTHIAHPVACRAACAVLDVIEEESLLENAREVGAFLLSGLQRAADEARLEAVAQGAGLMLGVEVFDGRGSPDPTRAAAIVAAAASRGVLLLDPIGVAKNVIRVSPPLVITGEQAAEGVSVLAEAFAEVA